MKKQIAIAAAITATLALWAAVSPQTAGVKETPAPSPMPTVATPQTPLTEPKEPEVSLTTELEQVEENIAEPVLEETVEQPPTSAPKPTAGNQDAPATEPTNTPEPEPTLEPEAANSSSENRVYVPGFGWIESQGPNQVTYAEDMYENGNKIGIMG
ncbi:MAG: hypothetical protein KHZ05_12690 [Oscillospiraceae bacterium]|nr:hypothetical protein [Oscillospiraceae bacterium]